jgi:hypothetical protein
MTIPESQSQIKIERFHFAVRLDLIQFPLNQEDIAAVLTVVGYQMSPERASILPGIPGMPQLRVMPAGLIAQSTDRQRTFSLDPGRGILVIQGDEIDRVLADFAGLREAIRERYIPDWDDKASFYEFILDANSRVGPERNPIEEIRTLHGRSKLFQHLGKALGISATTFGLRLVEKGRTAEETSWIEYTVTPTAGRSKTDYTVNIVYRHRDRESVVEEAKQALQKTKMVLNILKGDRP